jgi:hypothetical protein
MSGYYFGVGAVLVFWIMSYRITGNRVPWALAISEGSNQDKKKNKKEILSASKFQVLLWTLIVLFSYSSIFGARLLETLAENVVTTLPEILKALPMIPINLFLLMGFSVTTATGSKSVTITYKTRGIVSQKSGGLMQNPQGQGDLQKTQMLAWTIVGAIIYLMKVVTYISLKSYNLTDTLGMPLVPALPEVDNTLLILMGVSQGSYLGNKVVTKDVVKVPKINEILPLTGPKGASVTMLGENFGEPHEDNFVTIQGSIIRKDDAEFWNDKQIRVKIPDNFQKGDKINLGVYSHNNSSNKLTFEVTS